MRLLLPPRPAIRRDATTATYMIKSPLSVRLSRTSLSPLSVSPLALSLSLSPSRFRGRKARYAEIARSERRSLSLLETRESLSSSRVPSDSVARTPSLSPCHCLPPPAPSPPPSSPPSSSSSSLRRRFSTRRSCSREFDARRKQHGLESHGHGYGGPTIHSGSKSRCLDECNPPPTK